MGEQDDQALSERLSGRLDQGELPEAEAKEPDMVKTLTVTHFKENFWRYLGQLERGELTEIRVERHGHPFFRVLPPPKPILPPSPWGK